MFASSERESPWIAFACWVSFARTTVNVPSARSTFTSGWNVRRSSPFGPFTETCWPFTVTSTPLGSVTGSLPMRLMSSSPLPHVRQDLAAEGLALGLAAGHQARGGRDDRDAQAAEDPWHLGLARVDAQAWPADPPDPRDRGGLAADVLQLHHELRAGGEHFTLLRRLPLACRLRRVAADEPLGFQDPGDLDLHPARRDHHALVTRAGRVADPGQHVGHWVVHRDAAGPTRLRHDHAARARSVALGPLGPRRLGLGGRGRRRFGRHLFTNSTSSRLGARR